MYEVNRIFVSKFLFRSNKSYAVVLKEINGDRRLPIMLGSYMCYYNGMKFIDTQRPLTHDLL